MGAMAQKERVRNQPYADLKWLHLGFHVGIHSQDLLLTHTGVMTNGETWFAEIPSYSPGFSVRGDRRYVYESLFQFTFHAFYPFRR